MGRLTSRDRAIRRVAGRRQRELLYGRAARRSHHRIRHDLRVLSRGRRLNARWPTYRRPPRTPRFATLFGWRTSGSRSAWPRRLMSW